MAAFLGAAFFGAAFLGAAVVLATRPDLVLVKVLGLSTTAGAYVASKYSVWHKSSQTRGAYLLRGSSLLGGSLGGGRLLVLGLLLGGGLLSLGGGGLLLLGLLLDGRLLGRLGSSGLSRLLGQLGAAGSAC